MVTWVLSWTLGVGSERLESGFLEDQDGGREVGKGGCKVEEEVRSRRTEGERRARGGRIEGEMQM
jgi:hypothetical protein